MMSLVKYSLRRTKKNLRHSLLSVILTVCSLSLCFTIFTFVKAVKYDSIDLKAHSVIVEIGKKSNENTNFYENFSYEEYIELSDSYPKNNIAAFERSETTVESRGGSLVSIGVGEVSYKFFDLINVDRVKGRVFEQQDELYERRVAIINKKLVQKLLLNDETALNSIINLQGQAYQIIGIVDELLFPESQMLWIPIDVKSSNLQLAARLETGQTVLKFEQSLRGQFEQLYKDRASIDIKPTVALFGHLLNMQSAFGLIVDTIFTAGCFILGFAAINVSMLILSQVNCEISDLQVFRSLEIPQKTIFFIYLIRIALILLCSSLVVLFITLPFMSIVNAVMKDLQGDYMPSWWILELDVKLFILQKVAFFLVSSVVVYLSLLSLKHTHSLRYDRFKKVVSSILLNIEIVTLFFMVCVCAIFVSNAWELNGFISKPILKNLKYAQFQKQDNDVFTLADLEKLRNTINSRFSDNVAIMSALPSENNYFVQVIDQASSVDKSSQVYAGLTDIDSNYFSLVTSPFVFGVRSTSLSSDQIVINESLSLKIWGTVDSIGREFSVYELGDQKKYTVVGIVEDLQLKNNREINAKLEIYRALNNANLPTRVFAVTNDVVMLSQNRDSIVAWETLMINNELIWHSFADRIFRKNGAVIFFAGFFFVFSVTVILLGISGIFAQSQDSLISKNVENNLRLSFGATHFELFRRSSFLLIKAIVPGCLIGIFFVAVVIFFVEENTPIVFDSTVVIPFSLMASVFVILCSTIISNLNVFKLNPLGLLDEE